MALPVSIGDVIMLSKLAYQLGQAFTTGRKSAPAEFEDVRNLLYSLSTALELIVRDLPEVASSNISTCDNVSKKEQEDNILVHIVSNCKRTLTYLEATVAKYSILEDDPNQPKKTRMKSWSEDIRKNWKKIVWTKEGGDLVKLKATLVAHMNSLTLAISAATRHQGAASQEQIDTIHTKLDDIHQWFTANLQAGECDTPRRTQVERRRSSPLPSPEKLPLLTFSISEVTMQSPTQRLICPSASFSDQWLSNPESNTTQSIFQCHCHLNTSSRTSQSSHPLLFYVLPVSLLVQNVVPLSKRSWQVYVGSQRSNTPVSLCLTDVSPMHLAKFEAYIVELAVWQAALYTKQGISSLLISCSTSDGHSNDISILLSKVPASDMDSPISTTFTSNGYHFSPGRVESIQLLNYGLLPETSSSSVSQGLDSTQTLLHQPNAELILQCSNQGSGRGHEARYVIQIDYDTKITENSNQKSICLEDILCTSEGDDNDGSTPQRIRCSTIEFQFASTSAVESFIGGLKAMRRELFILYLQYPRAEERILHQRVAGDLMIRHCYLTKAHLSLVLNPLTRECRMILLSSCHSISVCLELPESFLENLATTSQSPNRTYPAWFVEITKHGTNMLKQSTNVESLLSIQGTMSTQQIALPLWAAHQDDDMNMGES